MADPLSVGSAALARALGLSRRELHVLRNVGAPELRIAASEGRGTRDQRWSFEDALRMAALAGLRRLGVTASPGRRCLVFEAIGDEDVAAARRGIERYLAVSEEGASVSHDPLLPWRSRHRAGERAPTAMALLPLHRLAPDLLGRLRED